MFPKLKNESEFTSGDIDTLKKNSKFSDIERLID